MIINEALMQFNDVLKMFRLYGNVWILQRREKGHIQMFQIQRFRKI